MTWSSGCLTKDNHFFIHARLKTAQVLAERENVNPERDKLSQHQSDDNSGKTERFDDGISGKYAENAAGNKRDKDQTGAFQCTDRITERITDEDDDIQNTEGHQQVLIFHKFTTVKGKDDLFAEDGDQSQQCQGDHPHLQCELPEITKHFFRTAYALKACGPHGNDIFHGKEEHVGDAYDVLCHTGGTDGPRPENSTSGNNEEVPAEPLERAVAVSHLLKSQCSRMTALIFFGLYLS